MILVTVGQQNTADFILILFEVGDIRDNKVYTKHILIGKCETAVDYYDVVFIFKDGDVFSDLVQTAQKHDFKF